MEAIKEKEYIMYKIICNTDDNLIYIGSTTNFKCRKNQHKESCNNLKSEKYNYKIYENIRNNGGWENWNMQAIEIYNTDNKIKARIRETKLMEDYKSNLNMRKSYISQEEKKEYKIEYDKNKNKDYYLIKSKEYYNNNKEEINKRRKELIICECRCEIRKDTLKRHKRSLKHIKFITETNNLNNEKI